MKKIECFKIRIEKTKKTFELSSGNIIKEINCSKYSSLMEPTTIVADPFLFVNNETLFLFYEDKRMYKNGVISMTSTKDLKNWSKPVVVLREECHLSYPWVFEEKGHIYMIPETCGLKEIRLYEGLPDLTSFKFVKTIMHDEKSYTDGFSFSDSSIQKKDGIFYLMTTINDGKDNILKLYFSDKLEGGYKEHPMSPLYVGNKYGRNAGCLIEKDGKLLRVAQDCIERYGDNVHLLEITKISPTEYYEKSLRDNLLPTDIEFYREGGHQFNMVKFRDEYIIATDAKEYHMFCISRILKRLGFYNQ